VWEILNFKYFCHESFNLMKIGCQTWVLNPYHLPTQNWLNAIIHVHDIWGLVIDRGTPITKHLAIMGSFNCAFKWVDKWKRKHLSPFKANLMTKYKFEAFFSQCFSTFNLRYWFCVWLIMSETLVQNQIYPSIKGGAWWWV
jgi:hypothetical protein